MILLPHRKYLRRRTAKALQQVANGPERYADPEHWTAQMNSYLGLCRHANTYNLRKQIATETGATFGPNLSKVVNRRKAA